MPLSGFSISELLKRGWELTKEYLGFLIAYQIILWILVGLMAAAEDRWFLHLALWILVIFAKMGLYGAALLISREFKPGFDQLYIHWRKFFSWIIANILFGLMFVIGLILLIVPAFYVLSRYGLFPFFIIDKDSGPIEALKQSSKATEGIRWDLFLFFLAAIGINILGALVFGVGLLVTIPVTLLALTTLYRRLQVSTPDVYGT